jgi:hypothetical protein
MTKEERKKEYKKAYYEANKEKLKEKQKAYNEANKERRKEKQKAYYEKNKDKIEGYQKKYRKANKERKAEKDKAYYEANRDKIEEYSKAYYQANKEKRKAYNEANIENRKAYRKKKWNTDPLYRLKLNLRNASRRAWKGQTKNATTEKLLGCTYNDFKDYITAQFVGNMSWDNYGDVWHVDHIIPLATVEDVSQTELISSLCHYSNLQPLFACHNCSKSDKLDYEYPAIYKTNLLHNSNKK